MCEAVGGDGEGNLLLKSSLLKQAWEVMGPDVRGFPCREGERGSERGGGEGAGLGPRPCPAPYLRVTAARCSHSRARCSGER